MCAELRHVRIHRKRRYSIRAFCILRRKFATFDSSFNRLFRNGPGVRWFFFRYHTDNQSRLHSFVCRICLSEVSDDRKKKSNEASGASERDISHGFVGIISGIFELGGGAPQIRECSAM